MKNKRYAGERYDDDEAYQQLKIALENAVQALLDARKSSQAAMRAENDARFAVDIARGRVEKFDRN